MFRNNYTHANMFYQFQQIRYTNETFNTVGSKIIRTLEIIRVEKLIPNAVL